MSDPFDLDPARLTRYFTGECTRAEAAAFERWAAAQPERQAYVAELRKVWDTGAIRLGAPIDAESAWNNIVGQLGGSLTASSQPRLKVERGGVEMGRGAVLAQAAVWRRVARRVAAAAALVLVTGGAVWFTRTNFTVPRAAYTVSTEHGGRRTVVLDDGTRVTLGPLSRLRVAQSGSMPSREVTLEGQAFFQVSHDPRHPFRVHTKLAETKVLGTEFTVRAYGDEPDAQVAVRSGRVAVRQVSGAAVAFDGPTITAGQRAIVRPGSPVRVGGLDDSSAFAWTTGPLRFESAKLSEVAREMSRWIDLEIVLSDEALGATRVTVTFPDLSRDSVLARLARLTGARAVARRSGAVLLGKTDSISAR